MVKVLVSYFRDSDTPAIQYSNTPFLRLLSYFAAVIIRLAI